MKMTRRIEVRTNKFKIGDVISFTLTDVEKVRARAVKKEDSGMLFVTVDCLNTEYPMNANGDNEGGYEGSDLRKALNTEILNRFPEEIRERMQPMEYGDLLRIPTEREIFGENEYGKFDSAEQWLCMKKRRNRMALREEDLCWYWLQNQYAENASFFCAVGCDGFADARFASRSLGVRPVFLLS